MFGRIKSWLRAKAAAALLFVALAVGFYTYQLLNWRGLLWFLAGLLPLALRFPQAVAFVNHLIDLFEKLVGQAVKGPPAEEQPKQPKRVGRWLTCIGGALFVLAFSGQTTGHDEEAGDTRPSPATIHVPAPVSEWAAKPWTFAEAVEGWDTFDANVSFAQGRDKDGLIVFSGLSNGPIRLRIIDERTNPTYAIVECGDHGWPIGVAIIRFRPDNSIDIKVFLDEDQGGRRSERLRSIFRCPNPEVDHSLIAVDMP